MYKDNVQTKQIGLEQHLVLMEGELGEKWAKGQIDSCLAWSPEIDIEGATKEKGKSVENQLKETLKPATEAYFAFLDQSWRELATKSPQLTPKQIQVPPLLCNYHVFVIYIYTGWFFYLSALKND